MWPLDLEIKVRVPKGNTNPADITERNTPGASLHSVLSLSMQKGPEAPGAATPLPKGQMASGAKAFEDLWSVLFISQLRKDKWPDWTIYCQVNDQDTARSQTI